MEELQDILHLQDATDLLAVSRLLQPPQPFC